jgi:CheY-like chemotaxis protein
MDGFEVLRNVKQDSRLKDIPIFILSAKTLTESDVAFLRRQTQALFQKDGPWREELIAILTHTIETRRKGHQAGSA